MEEFAADRPFEAIAGDVMHRRRQHFSTIGHFVDERHFIARNALRHI